MLFADKRALETLDNQTLAELQPVRIPVLARVLEGPSLLAHEAPHELHQHNRVLANHRVAAALRDLRHGQAVAEILELEVARRRCGWRQCRRSGAGHELPPRWLQAAGGYAQQRERPHRCSQPTALIPQVLGLLQTLCSLLDSPTQCGRTAALAAQPREQAALKLKAG